MVRNLKIYGVAGPREVYEVVLSEYEYRLAKYAGELRMEESVSLGLKARAGADNDKDGLDINITGAIGEYVASVVTGRAWTAFTDFRAPDLAGGIEVRTSSQPHYGLKLYKSDPDETPFIHVAATNSYLIWRVTGWLLAKDGKQKIFFGDPTRSGRPPAYFVDQAFLKSINELKLRHLKEAA